MSVKLLLRFFMRRVFPAETAELFELQTFRLLFLVLGAVVGNAIATGALKVNGLAHVVPSSLALLRLRPNTFVRDFGGQARRTELQKMLRNVTSPRAVLNR